MKNYYYYSNKYIYIQKIINIITKLKIYPYNSFDPFIGFFIIFGTGINLHSRLSSSLIVNAYPYIQKLYPFPYTLISKVSTT